MRRNIIYFVIGGLVIIIFGVLIWLFVHSNNQTNTPNVSNVPSYQLTQDEEDHLRSFVKTFIELYNTYSTGDYSNLYALGDYQTTDMQYRTKALITQLEQETPENYDLVSTEVPGAMTYIYNQGNTIKVSDQVDVVEMINGKTVKYQESVDLIVMKNGSKYFVDNIIYTKK